MRFTNSKKTTLIVTGVMAAIVFIRTSNSQQVAGSQWQVMGHDPVNSRSQPDERVIGTTNAASLTTKWVATTGGDVSATPTVDTDAIYVPDWAGRLFALRRDNGTIIWSHNISDYNRVSGSISRNSPAIHGDDLIFGDIKSGNATHNGAHVMAVNRRTGVLHWITQVETHPAAMITASPVFAGDIVYVGVSSSEETLAVDPAYPCCSFRGSMVALDANTGKMLWKTYDMPDNHALADGYSGGAIWQPAAIDVIRGSLYVGTGNNYEVPLAVKACIAKAGSDAAKTQCFAGDDYYDAALSLDLNTGKIKWAKTLQGVDIWTVACTKNPTPVSCPLPSSPDYDFSGSGPNLLPNLVGFGQKSGIYFALNPDDGGILWSTMVGPGSTLGGIEWGTASDGQRIYAAITNSAHKPYPLVDGTSVTWGAWSALDAGTGKILWQTADPARGLAMGSVSVANGVLYAPSISGNMHALDAATGQVLWTFQSGGSVLDGPAVVDGTLFWGSGYKKTGGGAANNRVYAFTVNAPTQ